MAENNKSLLVGLIVFTIIIIFFGFWQIRYNIFSPFKGSETIAGPTETDIINVYKALDTDQDGLSDYEEMNIYSTSAYLPDSDGDNFTDKEEIEAGSDPLNPYSTPETKAMAQEKTILEQEIKPETSEIITGSEEISAQEIRDLLISQGGLSKELVDSILDEDLIKLYNETKKETGVDLKDLVKGAVKSENLKETEKMIEEIDPETLRRLLILEGVDPEILETIDDQSLKELFLQGLEKTNP